MHDFQRAVTAGIITADQAARLRDFFGADASPPVAQVPSAAPGMLRPTFDLAHVLWYAGALMIIGAMSWFTTLGFAALGGGFLAVTGVIYAIAAWAIGHHLWTAKKLRTPGGLFIAIAVSMVPMVVFGVQDMLGWWSNPGKPGNYKDFHIWIKGGWVPMEIATFIASWLAIRRYPFGFIAFIAAVAAWYFAMDLAQWIAQTEDYSWKLRQRITMWLGLATIAFAWFVDLKQRKADYAYWLHLAGLLGFWGGITYLLVESNSLSMFAYFLINLAIIAVGLVLDRRMYLTFGTMGALIYFGYLANRLFKDSLLFPFAATLMGLAVIAAGLWYHKNAARIGAFFEGIIPEALKRLRPHGLTG
ncbi:MAG: hypothetical protein ACRCUX_11805 [Beijerinckiaceae bacterium]